MADKIRYLRRSDLGTECDACGARLDLMTGGVCERCERILCSRHLHGSWLRRMLHEFRRPVTCVDCRAGRDPQLPAHALPSRRHAAATGARRD